MPLKVFNRDFLTAFSQAQLAARRQPPPNLNFTNIFYTRFGAKPPNLKTTNISGYTVHGNLIQSSQVFFVYYSIHKLLIIDVYKHTSRLVLIVT